MTGFDSFVNAAAFRDILDDIINQALAKRFPPSRVGQVVDINRDALSATIAFADGSDQLEISFSPSFQPRAVGNIVRVTGTPGAYTVSNILDDTSVHATYETLISGDSAAPTDAPTIEVRGGIRSLFVTWAPVANSTTVTYDVYVSDTAGIDTSTATPIGSTTSNIFHITELTPGVALVPAGTYYVVVVPRDIDGPGPASAEVSGTVAQINSDDIVVNSITSDNIATNYAYVGSLSATQISAALAQADITLSRKFITGTSGQRVEVGADGIKWFAADDSPDAPSILLPTDPNQVPTFTGDAFINNLTVNTLTTLKDSKLAPGSAFTLTGGVQPPGNTPSISATLGSVSVTGISPRYGGHAYARGLTFNGTNGYLCVWGDKVQTAWADGRIIVFPKAGGAVSQTLSVSITGSDGKEYVVDPLDLSWNGTHWYVLVRDRVYVSENGLNYEIYSVIRYDANWNRVDLIRDLVGQGYILNGIHAKSNGDFYCIGSDTGDANNNNCRVLLFGANFSTWPSSSWNFADPKTVTASDSDNTGIGYGLYVGTADFGGTTERYVVPFTGSDLTIRGFTRPTGTYPSEDTTLAWKSLSHTYGLEYDGTNWYSVEQADVTNGFSLYKWSSYNKTASSLTQTLYAAYNWRTSSYYTQPGPISAFTMYKRRTVSATTPKPPVLGTGNDPDRSSLFYGTAANSLVTAVIGNAGQTSFAFDPATVGFGGSAAPTLNTFPGGAAVSSIKRADGSTLVDSNGMFPATTKFTASGGTANPAILIESANPEIAFHDTDLTAGSAGTRYWIHNNSGRLFFLQDRNDDNAWDSPHPFYIESDGRLVLGFEANAAGNPIRRSEISAGSVGSISFNGVSSVSYNLSFGKTFSAVPRVVAMPTGTTVLYANASSITTTGCTVVLSHRDGAAYTATVAFDWIAMVPSAV